MRRSRQVAAEIEHGFEVARARAGLTVDQTILSGFARKLAPAAGLVPEPVSGPMGQVAEGPTLRQVYDAYMADPTRDWSPRTRFAYETTRRVVLAVLGEDTPVRSITRAHCRDLIETLRSLPRNASKRYPRLSPVEAAAKAKGAGDTDLISPANLNAYLNKFGGVLNWAVKEEMVDRNPAHGLRVPDPTLRRDKRLPFSTAQLRAMFTAPLYTGCRDDGHGYAVPGEQRPRNARFWIPLIGLHCGLRLNEACQLDVSDVRMIEEIACFVVTEASEGDGTDKRLKTASSARVVPVHREVLALNFMQFVGERRRAGVTKLFGEVSLGATG
jgi:integrase